MTVQHYLAIDLGAESGRGILGAFDGGRLTLRESGGSRPGQGEEDIGRGRRPALGLRRASAARSGPARPRRSARRRGAGTASAWIAGAWTSACWTHKATAGSADALPGRAPPGAMREVHEAIPPEDIWDGDRHSVHAVQHAFPAAALQKRAPACWTARAPADDPRPAASPTDGRARARSARSPTPARPSWCSPRTRPWDPSLLTRLGLPSHFLGEILAGGSRVGETPKAASPSMRPAPTTPPPPSPPCPPSRARAGPFCRRAPGPCWAWNCPRRS